MNSENQSTFPATNTTPQVQALQQAGGEGRKAPKFKVGDVVLFTNDYGVKFPGKTITGFEYWEGYTEARYFYSPTQTPWFSVRESSLQLMPNK